VSTEGITLRWLDPDPEHGRPGALHVTAFLEDDGSVRLEEDYYSDEPNAVEDELVVDSQHVTLDVAAMVQLMNTWSQRNVLPRPLPLQRGEWKES
jgi:hypothetical protein